MVPYGTGNSTYCLHMANLHFFPFNFPFFYYTSYRGKKTRSDDYFFNGSGVFFLHDYTIRLKTFPHLTIFCMVPLFHSFLKLCAFGW